MCEGARDIRVVGREYQCGVGQCLPETASLQRSVYLIDLPQWITWIQPVSATVNDVVMLKNTSCGVR